MADNFNKGKNPADENSSTGSQTNPLPFYKFRVCVNRDFVTQHGSRCAR
jgi:hypothetical protein